MIQVFRSSTNSQGGFDRHSELCRDCAKIEVERGYYVEYDLYLSERTNAITKDDTCQMCYETFFLDGRKKLERIDGVIY